MKSVFAKVLLVTLVVALSTAGIIRPAVENTRTRGNFGPKVKKIFEIEPQPLFQNNFVQDDPIAIAKLYVSLRTNVAPASIRVSSSHTNARNGVTHVYLQQVVNGIDVVNGVANVNVHISGKVVSAGSSLFSNAIPTTDFTHSIKVSATEAVQSLAKLLKIESDATTLQAFSKASVDAAPAYTVSGASFALKPISAELKYMQTGDGATVALVWSLRVDMKDNVYNAFVDTTTGEVVSLIDWVSDATYNVYPLGINDPHSGERVKLVDPAHPVASPLGWHSQGEGLDFTGTISNNVYAQENPTGGVEYIDNKRPDGGDSLTFDFPIDFANQPVDYAEAATTNLFYWNNIIHDLLYVYGFNEEAGNFQENNLGRGGEGADAVVAFAQDGEGFDNANFMTPPDGQQGRMRMYLMTATDPMRDGDLDGGIVFHEYAHGLSNRLTGGPANVGCLGFGESGGMGEGWGDFLATITRTTVNSTRDDVYAMGDYSFGNPAGIRNYKYSTDLAVNPSTYQLVGDIFPIFVHDIGEIWAVILYDVYWNVVERNGFDPDWFNVDADKLGGNVIMLQLVLDGMKLQPCDPSFVDARDAIIQADQLNNNGDNFCALWKGFAKRGLGVEATSDPLSEDFTVPTECEEA